VLAVVLYLAAACGANVAVTLFGYAALPYTAALLIPFDLTARDVLHDRWHGNWLAARMAALVCTGSLLAWLCCNGSPAVCVASAGSFCIAGAVDAAVYAMLRGSPRSVRMNASNLASSTADSIAFPLVAFGTVSASLATTQVALKFVGGVAWVAAFLWLTRKAA
jgi:uncharacterized PurR-regulated membrane protein YhhQ (DUF165 family)